MMYVTDEGLLKIVIFRGGCQRNTRMRKQVTTGSIVICTLCIEWLVFNDNWAIYNYIKLPFDNDGGDVGLDVIQTSVFLKKVDGKLCIFDRFPLVVSIYIYNYIKLPFDNDGVCFARYQNV
jgi:hypothetical protein